MLLHLVFFQPLAQAADDFGGARVFAYDVINNGAHLGPVGIAIRQDPLGSLRVAKNRAERQAKLAALTHDPPDVSCFGSDQNRVSRTTRSQRESDLCP